MRRQNVRVLVLSILVTLAPAVFAQAPDKPVKPVKPDKPAEPALRARVDALEALLLEAGEERRVSARNVLEYLAPDGPSRVAILRALVQDPRERIRKPAIQALGLLGAEAADAAPDLVALLGDKGLADRQPRRQIRTVLRMPYDPMALAGTRFVGVLPEAIRRIGKPAVPALVRALDVGGRVRLRVLSVLEALGPAAADAVPVLRKLLGSETSDPVRVQAIRVLGEIGDAARIAVPELVVMFRTRKRELIPAHRYFMTETPALAAARALVLLDRPFVNAALDSDDPTDELLARRALSGFTGGTIQTHSSARARWLRRRALEAVGLPVEADTFAFLEALRGDDPDVRAVALASLPGRMPRDSREAVEKLAAFATDANPAVRRGAMACLAVFAESQRRRATQLAAAAVRDADVMVRRAAFCALERLDAQLHLPAVRAATGDPDDRVAASATRILCRLQWGRSQIPGLLETLLAVARGDRSATVRVEAVKGLEGQAGRSSAVAPALAALLDDASTAVRAEALRVLPREHLRARVAQIRPRLLAWLGDPDPRLRLSAATALVALGHEALDAEPLLRRLLEDPDPGVRQRMAALMKNLELRKDRFRNVQRDAASRDRDARIRAVGRSREFGKQARPLIVAALDDPDMSVRRQAAMSLLASGEVMWLAQVYRKTGSWRVRAALLAGLEASSAPMPMPDPKRAKQAARVGALVQELQAEVRAALDHERVELRRAALGLAGTLGRDPGLLARLWEAARDPDEQVAYAARAVLRRQGEPRLDLPGLIRALGDPKMDPCLVLEKLNKLGEKAVTALPALRAGMQKARGVMQGYFAFTLGNVGRARAAPDVPAVASLLDDEVPLVRSQAAYALEAIGPPARSTVDRLVQIYEKDPVPSVRCSAVHALGSITRGTDAAVPLLIRALADDYWPCRSAAASALGEVGPAARAAVPSLETLARNGTSEVREPARNALEKIRPAVSVEDRVRIRCVSARPDTGATASAHCWNPAISKDGRFVAFDSDAGDRIEPPTPGRPFRGRVRQVYVYDGKENRLVRVSVSPTGEPGNGESQAPALSADGRFVAFVSAADNLVSGDHNGKADVFVHDRATGKTSRVSVSSKGDQGSDRSFAPSLSDDGRTVAFVSLADNLVPEDDNRSLDVFVHDRRTGKTIRASVNTDGREANRGSHSPVLSPDGERVAFVSHADNLVADDTGGTSDVFVHDLAQRRTCRVSGPADGFRGGGSCGSARFTDRGRRVVFTCRIGRRGVAPEPSVWYVLVYDLAARTTRILLGPIRQTGKRDLLSAISLSEDGRRLVFSSASGNFAADGNGDRTEVFACELKTKTFDRVSVDSRGQPAGMSSHSPVISADGRFVAFVSFADLAAGDRNGRPDIYVRRLE